MDPSLAESMGVNTESLLLSRPNSAENLLSGVNTLTKSGSVDVIVVDSVSNCLSKNYSLEKLFLVSFTSLVTFFSQILLTSSKRGFSHLYNY